MDRRILSLFFFLIMSSAGRAQVENFKWINVQGQFTQTAGTTTSFEFLVLSIDNDTLYRESHTDVVLSSEGSFTLAFGNGMFSGGLYSDFYDLDWTIVDKIELYHIGESRYLQASYSLFAVPYTFHSRSLGTIPSVSNLLDVLPGDLLENTYLKFDGINYYLATAMLSDSALFSFFSDLSGYTDTAWFAYNHDFADSAFFSYFADSAHFSMSTVSVFSSDTAAYSDSSSVALSAIGNWSISGNELGIDTNFLGSIEEEDLVFRTNLNKRLILGAGSEITNNFPGLGFRMFLPLKGALFTPNTDTGLSSIAGAYVYFDGATYSFHGGTSAGDIDTLKGMYSFAFGEDVGTNGTYSTVFGKNTYGDTALFAGSIPYASISSFALGRNCHVAHMGVAIGDSAIANYYRNVAIGRNVISNNQSAGLAIGSNVIVKGATSWAMGHNLTATGNFATVMGTNASTLTRKGGFLYGDASTSDTVFSLIDNQFIARADGGVIFYSSGDLSMGVELLPGAGSWSMISDRSKKMNIIQLDPLNFESHYDSLPLFSWNYIGQTTVHIGPMAQDLYRLFDVGEKDYLINMIDADGVTFLGIKYLKLRVEKAPDVQEIDELEEELRKEQEAQAELERRLKELYEKVDTH